MELEQKVAMETERCCGLVHGFGWRKQKEELVGRELRITLTKEVIEIETEESVETGAG